MNLHIIFERIKKAFLVIDYKSTLKLLVRAKLCAKLREDIYLLISKYLDFVEAYKNMEQLREESASDLISV